MTSGWASILVGELTFTKMGVRCGVRGLMELMVEDDVEFASDLASPMIRSIATVRHEIIIAASVRWQRFGSESFGFCLRHC